MKFLFLPVFFILFYFAAAAQNDTPAETSKDSLVELPESLPRMKMISLEGRADDLTQDVRTYLDTVAVYLKLYPQLKVKIIVHTDDQGTLQENQELSLNNGNKAIDYLVALGVNRQKIFMSGMGGARPIGDNKIPAGRRLNNRMEFVIIEKK